MILYHAVSSYQLLCLMTHKLLFHQDKKSVLLLPDFILEKYPQYMKLVELNIFDEVYLFPYLKIDHKRETVLQRVAYFYHLMVPYRIDMFEEYFIAGAHFYFTLYLTKMKIFFHFFEDAAGMLSNPEQLYFNLKKTFPIHAEIAKENGLFNGSNAYIKDIYCLSKSETIQSKYIEFQIQDWLAALSYRKKNKIISFFELRKIGVKRNAIVFFTQQFSGLGIMSMEQQIYLVEKVIRLLCRQCTVILKRHPDDNVSYQLPDDVFIISNPFPAELLPFILTPCPKAAVTISSTSIRSMKKIFKKTFSFADEFRSAYSFTDEYTSMINIINTIEKEAKHVQLFKTKEK